MYTIKFKLIWRTEKTDIYKINCANDNKVYTEQTIRNMNVRVQEYLQNVRWNEVDKSWTVTQLLDQDHSIDEMKLLKHITKNTDVNYLGENAHSQEQRLCYNFDKAPENSLIIKYKFTTIVF